MNSKNVLLTIVAILMAVVIGGELCVYFGYDLYHSENGIFLRHKVYIATYQNMSENELRQRTETGDADAMAMLSCTIFNAHKGTEYKEVLELAQKSADKNCPSGKNMLGLLYTIGYCVPQNLQKAFDLYKDAANENEPAALNNIGNAYLSGLVVEKDTIQGLMFLEKSAIEGFPTSQYQLGTLYYNGGKTMQKNVNKAIEWYTLASDQGMPLAQYELSKIYYHGESGEIAPDYNKAKDLCRKAAEQGLPEAKWALENKFNSKNN